MKLTIAAVSLALTSTAAFAPSSLTTGARGVVKITNDVPQPPSIVTAPTTSTSLFMAEEEEKPQKLAGGIDASTRSKLLAESIAPWRTVRLFGYFSLGSGATIGGLITLSGVAAAVAGARTDLDLNTEYLNLAIDFGFAIAFALLAKWDFGKADELSEKVEEKLQEKKDNKVVRKAMKERELTLSKLQLDIRVAEDGSTQVATVEAVQTGGKQNMIVVVGKKKAIRDALLGANILKMEFAMRDVLIVPYEIDKVKSIKSKLEQDDKIKPDGQKGFGEDARPTWETQSYVAQPVGEGWEEYINGELQDAITQNGEKVKDDGIAIVVANTGEIIRRGVGQVPWRNMVEELENTTKDDELIDLGFLQG